MTPTLQMEHLHRTAAALVKTTVAYEAIRDCAADHKAEAYDASQRLATANADKARRKVAMALCDALPGASEDAVELVDDAAVNEAVAAEFKIRTDRALVAMNAAQAAHNDAARGFLIREAVEPAATRLAAALDSVAAAAAAAELMGAHYAAYERFPKVGGYASIMRDVFGPAADLIRHLSRDFTWTESPYTIRPGWSPKHGPSLEIGNLAGVAESERAALAMVDEASR